MAYRVYGKCLRLVRGVPPEDFAVSCFYIDDQAAFLWQKLQAVGKKESARTERFFVSGKQIQQWARLEIFRSRAEKEIVRGRNGVYFPAQAGLQRLLQQAYKTTGRDRVAGNGSPVSVSIKGMRQPFDKFPQRPLFLPA